jgi:hypothetical protein
MKPLHFSTCETANYITYAYCASQNIDLRFFIPESHVKWRDSDQTQWSSLYSLRILREEYHDFEFTPVIFAANSTGLLVRVTILNIKQPRGDNGHSAAVLRSILTRGVRPVSVPPF